MTTKQPIIEDANIPADLRSADAGEPWNLFRPHSKATHNSLDDFQSVFTSTNSLYGSNASYRSSDHDSPLTLSDVLTLSHPGSKLSSCTQSTASDSLERCKIWVRGQNSGENKYRQMEDDLYSCLSEQAATGRGDSYKNKYEIAPHGVIIREEPEYQSDGVGQSLSNMSNNAAFCEINDLKKCSSKSWLDCGESSISCESEFWELSLLSVDDDGNMTAIDGGDVTVKAVKTAAPYERKPVCQLVSYYDDENNPSEQSDSFKSVQIADYVPTHIECKLCRKKKKNTAEKDSQTPIIDKSYRSGHFITKIDIPRLTTSCITIDSHSPGHFVSKMYIPWIQYKQLTPCITIDRCWA